jgi:hypothetical protein
MASLNALRDRGLVRDGFVYGAYVSPDGEIHRVDFDGGWNGVADCGNAMPGDSYVSLEHIPVRIVRCYFGEVVAPEDMPRVLNAIRYQIVVD